MYHVKKEFTYGKDTWSVGSTIKGDEYPKSVIESLLNKGAIEEFEKLEIDEPRLEIEESEKGEDVWRELGKELDETSGLPQKWNPSRDDPDVQKKVGESIFGTVVRTGSGPYGRFVVVEEKDTKEKRTIWEQTALSDLMDRVKADDKVAVRFEGLAENPRGQKYLNYSTALRSC